MTGAIQALCRLLVHSEELCCLLADSKYAMCQLPVQLGAIGWLFGCFVVSWQTAKMRRTAKCQIPVVKNYIVCE